MSTPVYRSIAVIKKTIHIIASWFGLEFYLENGKVRLGKRHYLGGNHLKDIARIANGAGNIKVCIDGGAHRGETSLDFAKAFPMGKIFSFEPEPDNYRLLAKVVDHCHRIVPINMAIGEVSAQATFFVNEGSLTGSLLPAASGSGKYVHDHSVMRPVAEIIVPVVSLSEWAKEENIVSIDLLKLDLQGYELKALKGARFLLEQRRVLFIVLEVNFVPAYDGQASFCELYDFITGYGYRFVGLYPGEFNARKFHYRCGGDLLFVLENPNEYSQS